MAADYDNDGTISAFDFGQFRNRFGVTLIGSPRKPGSPRLQPRAGRVDYPTAAARLTFPGSLPMSHVRRRAGRLFARPRLLALEDRIAPAGGALDPTFGFNGIATFSCGDQFSTDKANVAALQADGKIIIAGSAETSGNNPFALLRLHPNGSLDTTFGTNGRVVTVETSPGSVYGLVVQSDGKIVAGGLVFSPTNNLLNLVRYNTDGSIDLTYGANGIVSISVGPGQYASAPTMGGLIGLPGGKVLAAVGQGSSFVLRRFNSDGSLDGSFGGGGVASASVGSTAHVNRVALQPDGKIIVVGSAFVDSRYQAVIVRFLAGGNLDLTFNGDGQAHLSLTSVSTEAKGVAIAPDGAIIYCGQFEYPFGGGTGTFVARLNPDGTNAGNTFETLALTWSDVAVQADGRFIAVGGQITGTNLAAKVTRYFSNLGPDSSFGGGIVSTQLSSGYDYFNDVLIQPDGKIVAVGFAFSTSYDSNFGIARYLSGGGIVVTPGTPLTTTEAGGTAQFTVALSYAPTANVTVPVAANLVGEGTLSTASLTFTPANWQVPQVVTVTGLDDPFDDGDVTYLVRVGPAASGDPEYQDLRGNDVRVTNLDDDTAGIAVTPTAGLVTNENGPTSTSFTIVLNCEPQVNVNIGLGSSSPSDGGPTVSSLTFTPANWQTPQTVTVAGADDLVDDDDVTFTVVTAPAVSTDPAYGGLNAADVLVLNLDNDTAGIEVVAATPLVTTEAGGTATFTVRLLTIPRNTVTLPVSSSDATEGTVAPASLTFPADASALTPRTVTVTGVNDFIVDGDINYAVVLAAAVSVDPTYAGMAPPDLPAVNRDNDMAGVVVTPTTGLVTTEAGGTAMFTIRLTAVPAADVTISLSSSDPSEGTVPASVTLTPANAMSGVAVTVTGVNDGIVDGPVGYTIVTGASTSADPNFAGLDPADVSVTNLDNDPIQIVGYTLNDGAAQRSSFKRFAFTFGQVVTASPTAFRVRRADGYEPALTLVHTVANGQTTVTVTFSGPGIIAGSVPDGVYGLTVFGDQVLDAFAQPLDGDGDGQPGGDFTTGFHRLFGDVDGDATVNAADFAQFRGAFGTIAGLPGYRDYLDYDGDGAISAFDFGQFRNRFGVTLIGPP